MPVVQPRLLGFLLAAGALLLLGGCASERIVLSAAHPAHSEVAPSPPREVGRVLVVEPSPPAPAPAPPPDPLEAHPEQHGDLPLEEDASPPDAESPAGHEPPSTPRQAPAPTAPRGTGPDTDDDDEHDVHDDEDAEDEHEHHHGGHP